MKMTVKRTRRTNVPVLKNGRRVGTSSINMSGDSIISISITDLDDDVAKEILKPKHDSFSILKKGECMDMDGKIIKL